MFRQAILITFSQISTYIYIYIYIYVCIYIYIYISKRLHNIQLLCDYMHHLTYAYAIDLQICTNESQDYHNWVEIYKQSVHAFRPKLELNGQTWASGAENDYVSCKIFDFRVKNVTFYWQKAQEGCNTFQLGVLRTDSCLKLGSCNGRSAWTGGLQGIRCTRHRPMSVLPSFVMQHIKRGGGLCRWSQFF